VRYPPWQSYTTEQSKRGVIIGTIHRIKEQNTSTKLAAESMFENYREYKSIGYPTTFYTKTMRRLTKNKEKSTISKIAQATIILIEEYETEDNKAQADNRERQY